MERNDIDTGDQVFGRRKPIRQGDRRRGRLQYSDPVDPDGVEDTEGHAMRTYPGAATDDELDCRMPLPGEEDERLRRL